LEATGGPDDIYYGGVFTRHTDGKGSRSPDKNGLGNLMIRYEHFTRAEDTNMRYTIYSNALQRLVLLAITYWQMMDLANDICTNG
jgi:hypothetical protein